MHGTGRVKLMLTIWQKTRRTITIHLEWFKFKDAHAKWNVNWEGKWVFFYERHIFKCLLGGIDNGKHVELGDTWNSTITAWKWGFQQKISLMNVNQPTFFCGPVYIY